MVHEGTVIVLDLDGTLCPIKTEHQRYEDLEPVPGMMAKVREYKARGSYIVIQTARSMRTYAGNVGRINASTARSVLDWLDRHEVPYDEVHFGKPWSGRTGFYVDDRAVRPSEFLTLSHEQILQLLARE